MRALPAEAATQCGVFSIWQAERAGWTRSALRHAVSTGRLVRLRVGAYQATDLHEVVEGLDPFEEARWRHAAPAIASVLTTPGAVASHSTAAVLGGIPLIFLPDRSCLSVVPWLTGEVPRVHLHRCSMPPRPFPIGEVDTTSVERIVIDLAREHGVPAGVVAADYTLRQHMTSIDALTAELDRCLRWPGVRAAREAIAFADPRSESVLESRSRLKLREFSLPTLEPQVRIGNERGRFVARVDFYSDEYGVVAEADGAVKYDGTEPRPLIEEKKRQEQLEDLHLEVVRWGTSDLSDFGSVARRLRRAFARGLQRPQSARLWTVLPPL